jgi:hypothetical protein
MDDFADQALLANVLRAKDYAPMNFNDLSSITGALSLSGTLGLTLPFGPYVGYRPLPSTGLGTYKDTVSPSMTGTTSPTINIGTLNTQGFMLTMIQPISTTYILSKWDSYPHELLLDLFVKAIRFPGEQDSESPGACSKNDPPDYGCEKRRVHVNDPDSDDYTDFITLVSHMVDRVNGKVDMKSLMILDPLGNPVPMGQTIQATTPIPTQSPAAAPTQAPRVATANAVLAATDEPVSDLQKRTYYVQLTYTDRTGAETAPSSEEIIQLSATQRLLVYSPPQLHPQQRGYNVYASERKGGETKQTAKPIRLGTNWPEPESGLTGDMGPPNSLALAYPINPAVRARDYYVELTFITSSGTETVPSPELKKALKEDEVATVSAPKTGTTGAIGYNVYIGTSAHDETKQNRTVVRIDQSWREPNSGLMAGAPPPPPPGTSYQVTSDYNIVQIINGLTDGQLHVGNASCPDFVKASVRADSGDLCGSKAGAPYVQFYKEYPAQIVLCLETDKTSHTFFGHRLAPPMEGQEEQVVDVTTAGEAAQENALPGYVSDSSILESLGEITTANFTRGGAIPTGGAPSAAGGAPAGGGAGAAGAGGSAGQGSATGGMSQVTIALQPNRISAILHSKTCNTDQIVLPTATEEEFHSESSKFTHIEWRSIAEVIQYLGAVARYQDRHSGDPNEKLPERFVGWTDRARMHRLFTYEKGTDGRISVDYRDGPYTSPMHFTNPDPGVVDHSLQTLALLNELIGIAKISGSLPVPQPVQVLP